MVQFLVTGDAIGRTIGNAMAMAMAKRARDLIGAAQRGLRQRQCLYLVGAESMITELLPGLNVHCNLHCPNRLTRFTVEVEDPGPNPVKSQVVTIVGEVEHIEGAEGAYASCR